MKKLLLGVLSFVFTASLVLAADEVSLTDLKNQIASLQKQVDEISKDTNKAYQHAVQDKLNLGIELRTRLDSIQYKDVRGLPAFATDMMQLWLTDSLTSAGSLTNGSYPATSFDKMNVMTMSAGQDGWNDAFLSKYMGDFQALMSKPEIQGMLGQAWAGLTAQQQAAYASFGPYAMMAFGMDMFANMLADRNVANPQEFQGILTAFKNITPRTYDSNNDVMFTNKLRVRLSSKVNENLSFSGRLVMYKTYGDSSGIRFFDGTFKSMALDGNSAALPSDDQIHVERAYFVYSNDLGDVHWHFSLGRRPSTYGYGYENHENSVVGGSPLPHIINWNFDGGSLGFALEDVVKIPGFNVKFCYGQGFEGQWGTVNSLNANADVNDVNMFGAIVKFYDDDQYRFLYNWARGYGITDGFVGLVAMPFYVRGIDNNLDSVYDSYVLEPNFGGYTSRFEPMSKIGDIDLHNIFLQGNTFGFSWFASAAMSKTYPKGSSKNPMFQFMGQDKLLGSDESKTGYSYWAGVMTPAIPFLKGKLGFEYNQGSKYWFNFTGAEDAVTGSKLATRGKVYEVYYHQPIVGDNFFATLGYLMYDYEYTNSGSPMGAPVKISEATGYNTMLPVVDIVKQFYAQLTYRY